VLRGFNKFDSLVLEGVVEYHLRAISKSFFLLLDPNDLSQVTDKTRKLGQVVCRGTQVTLICPSDEMEEIANPFAEDAEEEEALWKERKCNVMSRNSTPAALVCTPEQLPARFVLYPPC
jgi:U6 snRNA-associated Sm-like protein LSm7